MIRKTEWYAIAVIIASFVSIVMMCRSARSETLSTHNEEQAAYNAAIRVVMDRGCAPEFRRIRGYTVDVTPDRVLIIAKEVAQDCKTQSVTHTWAHPVAREDGTPLSASEIRGYQITIDGVVTMLAPVTAYKIDSGASSVDIQTVDTSGQLSQPVSLL